MIRVLFTVASKDRRFRYKRRNSYILFIATYGALLAYFRRLIKKKIRFAKNMKYHYH